MLALRNRWLEARGLPHPPRYYRSQAGYRAVQNHYDELLAQYPAPYEIQRVPTRYGVTQVIVSGAHNAPPLILLHGLGVHALIWLPNIAELSRHFRVYAVDIIGDAGRSADTRPSTLDDSYARWMCDLLDGLGLESSYFLTQSLGGWIALLTARYAPQRVKKLFLLYPGGIVTLKTSFFLQAFFSRFFWFWHPHFQEWNMLARFIWPHHPQINELIRRIFKHYYSKPVPPLPILSPRDLQQINAPVAILIGDHDEMFDPQYSLVRAQLMPGFAYGQIVPNAGHGMSVSHTDLVHEQVIQFLLGDS